jgi:hypothetical protein
MQVFKILNFDLKLNFELSKSHVSSKRFWITLPKNHCTEKI